MDSETIRFVRQEISRQLQIILSGTTGATTVDKETIDDLYPGMPSITNRPVMHPYGLSSRAPTGTISVNARMGEHVGNRIVIGHRDKDRPTLEEGETILYNQFGQAIYLADGEVHIGKKTAVNPAVLGTELKALLTDLITQISTHTHIVTAPGAASMPPMTAAQFVQLISENVSNDKIVSDYIFVDKEP